MTAFLLAAVAAVLVARVVGLRRPDGWLRARNERRFCTWAYGNRGAALSEALGDKGILFRDGEVVCFTGPAVEAGRARRDAVMASYFLPRQIVLTPAALGSRAADPLPCRTRIVESANGPLVIERRSLDARLP